MRIQNKQIGYYLDENKINIYQKIIVYLYILGEYL